MPNNNNNNNILGHDSLSPLIQIIQDLTRLISEEIDLLKSRRPSELNRLMPLKNQLMASYNKEISELNARGGLQSVGNGEILRTLKKETRLFQAVLTQHTRLVKALKTISENMIAAIGNEVVKTQNQSSRYGANGAKSNRKTPTSISLNQTI